MEKGGSISSCYNSVQGQGRICECDNLGSGRVVAKVQRYYIDVSSFNR